MSRQPLSIISQPNAHPHLHPNNHVTRNISEDIDKENAPPAIRGKLASPAASAGLKPLKLSATLNANTSTHGAGLKRFNIRGALRVVPSAAGNEEDRADEETHSKSPMTFTPQQKPRTPKPQTPILRPTPTPTPTPMPMPMPMPISIPMPIPQPQPLQKPSFTPPPPIPPPSTSPPPPPPAPLSQPSAVLTSDHLTMHNALYRVVRQIGKGGFSVVYHIQHTTTHAPFALKVIDVSQADDHAITTLKDEIKVLKRMSGSADVIQLYSYDLNKQDKQLFLLLELGGQDLAQWINTQRPLTLTKIKYVWESALLCLQQCHARQIVHLDLKPANFVWNVTAGGGRLQLIDFGIAKLIVNATSVVREQQIGTLNYMAPEQLQTRQTDTLVDDDTDGDNGGSSKLNYGTDVWALGCMLYQFIYGHTPFAHISNMFAKMKAICDPKHDVEFAEFGSAVMSGSAEAWRVSPAAIDCIKQCLNRNGRRRPTIRQLLSHEFLSQ